MLRPVPYFGSALAVLLALAVGILIERFIGLQSVLLVFLMAILASAILWGLLPSLLACVLSVLAFNFFLVPPVYTFAIADPDNAVALFFFLVVAVIVSNLTAKENVTERPLAGRSPSRLATPALASAAAERAAT